MYWPHIGGAQRMANELLPALKARGHEFLVLADQDSPELPAEDEYRGIRIRRFPFTAGLADVNTLADIRKKIVRLKRAFAPDLCHVVTLGATDFYHRITATTSPTPSVVSLRGIWPRQVERPLMQTLEAADWVACNSLSTLEYARRLVPKISSYSSVIYNALREPSMRREPLPFDPPRLLFLGRLSPEKRGDLVLDAFAEIRVKHPRAQLVIAGDGAERKSLETQAAHLELGDCVQFHGWIRPEDVPAWINSATLLLLPSEREAFGLAALEAGLMGRPVVASRRGGLPEVIEHDKTGLLVEPLDSAGVAEAAIWLLDHPDEARRMGEAAAVHTRERFIWEGCVNAHEALYEKLVRKPNRHLDGERDV
ncbi:glycosyltransferase family 4 protein [Candidatus Bipolaricaulota bacterium]